MRRYRLLRIEVPRFPVLQLTFDDGLEGPFDLQEYIQRGPFFEPLHDEGFFKSVAMAPNGRSFGWRLDQVGREIDFDVDAARIEVETALVEERAERYRRQHTEAAE
jgi:hypothetical protein